ncbi:MAG: PAS domain S-box protein [Bacteroidetes bacterium]|nr:MAG: PAS domain S-box protein [Bacteroidota bacterium]
MNSLAGSHLNKNIDDEAIFRQLEVMRSTLESMDDLVFVLDRNLLFTDFYSHHNSTSSLKGFTSAFRVGSHFSEAGFPDEAYSLFVDAVEKARNKKDTERISFSVKAFGGEFFYQAKLSPRFTLNNDFDGVTVVLRDISASVKSEEKLNNSLEYYLTVLLNFPNPIWRVNTHKEFDYFNNKWVEFTGIDAEKHTGTGWKSGIHPHDRPKVVEEFERSFANKKPFAFEYRLIHHSKKYKWVKTFCQPLFDHRNRFAGYMGSCFDIDDIRSTQQLLQESESRYRTMVQEQSDLVVRWKADFSITFANNSFCNFVGKPLEKLLGANWISLMNARENKEEIREFLKRAQNNQSSVFGTELQNKNQEKVVFQWLNSPVSDTKGKVIEYQSVGRDITEIVEKEKENQVLLIRLNEKVKELSLLNKVSQYINDELPEDSFFTYLANEISRSFLKPEHTFTLIEFREKIYTCNEYRLPDSFTEISFAFGNNHEGLIRVYRDQEVLRDENIDFVEENEKELLRTVCELINAYLEKLETDRKLQQSKSRFTELFESVLDIVFNIDAKGNILKINSAATQILGYSSFEGKNLLSLTAPTQRKDILLRLNKAIAAKEQSFSFETKALTKEGGMVFLQIKGIIKYRDYGMPLEIFGIARDITEQKRLEQDIMKTVITTEERERKRFAEDLHDGIGPLLSGLKMYLQQETLDIGLNDKQKRVLRYCRELVDDAIGQTRSIANNLTPGVLNDFGLERALLSHVAKINAIGKFSIRLKMQASLEIVENDVAIAIFRVVSELINNTLKHADCKQVEITLDIKKNIFSLVYNDDGVGFEPNETGKSVKGSHIGIKSIHNRIHSLNGNVTFFSEKGKGVFVKIFIPLKAQTL